MKYSQLEIVTQREDPHNARTPGFAFLVQAGYIAHDNTLTALGRHTHRHLETMAAESGDQFIEKLGLRTFSSDAETYFPLMTGTTEIMVCPACHYTARLEWARFKKDFPLPEPALPLEIKSTPQCNTIDALANFLDIPKSRTAKAMMFVRSGLDDFLFVVLRGDEQLSEAKLRKAMGDFRPASQAEIEKVGADPGYASPLSLKNITVVDDLIPHSPNLVAGANQSGFHYQNTNFDRDYITEFILDLAKASVGDPCIYCGQPLEIKKGIILATRNSYFIDQIVLALAEAYHDQNGLCLPPGISPFDVYLMHLVSKDFDTLTPAQDLYTRLKTCGISVLFDDRDERAGVKFIDAELIGCPVRLTFSKRNLKTGMVEFKLRNRHQPYLVDLKRLAGINHPADFWSFVENTHQA